jgi:hypothetical protein
LGSAPAVVALSAVAEHDPWPDAFFVPGALVERHTDGAGRGLAGVVGLDRDLPGRVRAFARRELDDLEGRVSVAATEEEEKEEKEEEAAAAGTEGGEGPLDRGAAGRACREGFTDRRPPPRPGPPRVERHQGTTGRWQVAVGVGVGGGGGAAGERGSVAWVSKHTLWNFLLSRESTLETLVVLFQVYTSWDAQTRKRKGERWKPELALFDDRSF